METQPHIYPILDGLFYKLCSITLNCLLRSTD